MMLRAYQKSSQSAAFLSHFMECIRIRPGMMILIQHINGYHIFRAQNKIKYLDILFNPFGVNGFRDGNDTSLQFPANYDLRDIFVVFVCDLFQRLIAEYFSMGQRAPCCHGNLIAKKELLHLCLFQKWMAFNLVYHRFDLTAVQ